MDSLLRDLAIFFLGIVVSALGFFVKRRYFSNPSKNSYNPDLHISPLREHDGFYAQVHNVGNDPIENLEITMSCLSNGTREHKRIYRFFNPNENPVTTSAHDCNFLNLEEKKKMASLIQNPDDGKIIFTVKGKGINSGKLLEKEFVINTKK